MMKLALRMAQNPISYRFDVYSNLPLHGDKAYNCGAALSHEEESHYRLNLWMIPHQFYMARVRGSSDIRYTIYATEIEDDDGKTRFVDPVGWAVPCESNKEYLELRFKFPRQCLYMSLFPKENHGV